jgi:hexokinase
MISGAYLGPLYLTTLKSASQEGAFSAQGKTVIDELATFNTKQLNDLITNPHLEGPLSSLASEDLEVAFILAQQLVNRAAWVSALKITASIRSLDVGKSPLHPICITIDGSTVHKMTGLYNTLESQLKELLGKEGIYFILSHREHAPILGAAIASLTN